MSLYKVVTASTVYIDSDSEESAIKSAKKLVDDGIVDSKTICSDMVNIIYNKDSVDYLVENLDGRCFNSNFNEIDIKDVINNSINKKAESVKNSIDMIISKEDVALWWMQKYLPNETHYFEYSAMKGKINRLFLSINISGYNPDTNQGCIKLTYHKGDSLKSISDELSLFLPYIIPHNNVKKISIFESSLSEYGSYFLHVDCDNNSKIIQIAHGRTYEIYQGSLDDCLAYIGQNLYYE